MALQFPTKYQSDTFFRISIYNVRGKSYKQIASGDEVMADYSRGETVILPLPTSGLGDNFSLRYDEAKTAAAATVSDFSSGVKLLAADAAKAAAQATGVYDTASLSTGMAIDPNVTPLFRGIDLRTLSLSWDLIPRSKSDSRMIANIVETLRLSALPGVVGNSVSSVLTFPSAYGLAIVVNGNDSMKSLPNLKSSKGSDFNWICESFNVSYNGGAPWSQFVDGEPTMVTIQMSFKEMTKQHRGAQSGFDGGGFLDAMAAQTPPPESGALAGTGAIPTP